MRATIALSAAAFVGLAASQTSPQNGYRYTIDPESVSSTDRDVWCNNQRAQCPLICLQQPDVTSMTTLANDCDPKALTYNCICENNVAPNITEYSQTLPYHICQQWGTNCVADCNGDNSCADSCRADHPCGAQSPYRGNTSLPTTSSARATPSGTALLPAGGFGGSQETDAPAGGSGAAAAMSMPGTGLTLAALMGSVFFGFAVLL